MGHTLIFTFDDMSIKKLNKVLNLTPIPLNKIPFGRSCDRAAANKILPYHITAAHWDKGKDPLFVDIAK